MCSASPSAVLRTACSASAALRTECSASAVLRTACSASAVLRTACSASAVLRTACSARSFSSGSWQCRQSQSPYNVFLSGCSYYTAKISYGRNVSIFMKRETLQKRHKQSNKHVFRVCMHSYMYITKVT